MTTLAMRVVAPGLATSVRGGGREGLAHVGCSRGGAVDLGSLELANRLVGNPEGAAGVETSGGLVLEVVTPTIVAVTGSQLELAVEQGPPLGWGVPTALPRGSVLRLGPLRGNARCYLAVRGGVLPIDWPMGLALAGGDVSPPSLSPAVPRGFDAPVRLWPGPRLDWFEPGTWDVLVAAVWRVSALSDRVGARLEGPALRRTEPRELPSEGLVEGAVQVPPDGQPIIMLADHPVTGGYPVIAVVDPRDVGLVAQQLPGAVLHFRRASGSHEH